MTTYAAAFKSPTLGQTHWQDVAITTHSSTSRGVDIQFVNTGIGNPYARRGTATFGFLFLTVDQS